MSFLLKIALVIFVIATVDKMGEIDDNYKENVESTDQKLLDELKDGKKGAIENYHKGLKKYQGILVKKYERKNAHDIRKTRNAKPKKLKKDTFDHLEIKHFNFEFTRYEKFKMWWNLFLFKIIRGFKISTSFIPSWMIYVYYKITKTAAFTYRDVSRYRENEWNGFSGSVVKMSVAFWKWLKEVYAKMKKGLGVILSKIMFWKKKKESEGEKKEGGNLEDEDKPNTEDKSKTA